MASTFIIKQEGKTIPTYKVFVTLMPSGDATDVTGQVIYSYDGKNETTSMNGIEYFSERKEFTGEMSVTIHILSINSHGSPCRNTRTSFSASGAVTSENPWHLSGGDGSITINVYGEY